MSSGPQASNAGDVTGDNLLQTDIENKAKAQARAEGKNPDMMNKMNGMSDPQQKIKNKAGEYSMTATFYIICFTIFIIML